MNNFISITNITKNNFVLKNILELKLKKINTQFYSMNSQFLKSKKT